MNSKKVKLRVLLILWVAPQQTIIEDNSLLKTQESKIKDLCVQNGWEVAGTVTNIKNSQGIVKEERLYHLKEALEVDIFFFFDFTESGNDIPIPVAANRSVKNGLPKLISVSDVREYLHISNAEAYRLVKTRGFPSVKIGNKYLIFAEKLPEWLMRQGLLKK